MPVSGSYINLLDLRGGQNSHDEPQSIPDDQVVASVNIDWDKGTLGGKRAGCSEVSITGSVLDRVIPILVSTTTQKIAGSNTLSLTVPVSSNDGTGTTYRLLVVKVVYVSSATAISSATFNGSAMGLQGDAGGIKFYGVLNPTLAGGTVAITWAGNVDAVVVAELWGQCDQYTTNATATTTSSTILTEITTTPTYVISGAAWYATSVTAVQGTPGGTANLTDETSGTLRVSSSYVTGRSPKIAQLYTLSGSSQWQQLLCKLRGAPVSAFSTSGYVLAALMRHTPTNNALEDELWIVDTFGRIDRRVNGTWQGGVPFVSMYGGIFSTDVDGASLHGKFFVSGAPAIGGLLVWDGTVMRFAGFPFTPTAPSVGNTGSGSYSGTRYFRIRFVAQDGSGNVLRRSEPSPSVSLSPSGTGSGALITKPTGTEDFSSPHCNGQTHWEVEASTDDVLFYRLATVAIGTGTYTDSTVFGGYADNPLSDEIGDNQALPAARLLAVDDDRLVLGGNRSVSLDSRVYWTPVEGDTGVGNDERIPISTENYIDLDGLDGGNLQALAAGESGNVYAFKLARIYKLTRTGVYESAYGNYTESRSRGCTKLGAVSGHDQNGTPCVYFTDPNVGLCKIGPAGIFQLGNDILSLWRTVRISTPSARGPRLVYWPDKNQIWIAVSTNASSDFNDGQFLVYNTRYGQGPTRGWSVYSSPLTALGIFHGVLFPDSTTGKMFPHWGMRAPRVVKFTLTDVNDAGNRYRAYWTSKAYLLAGLFRKFGVMAATLLGRAGSATVELGIIRNLGTETKRVTTSLALVTADGSATHVFRPMDNASLSECFAVQFEVGDPVAYSGSQLDQTWSLTQLALKVRSEEESA